MKRRIYSQLQAWKAEGGKTALMIEGARRIGKSYIAEEFAKNEYASYILIDFNKVGPKVKRWFGEHITLPTVLHTKDTDNEDDIRYLPLYMAPLV